MSPASLTNSLSFLSFPHLPAGGAVQHRSQAPQLRRRDERDSDAARPKAPAAPDAVHVRRRVVRQVEVGHQVDALEVDAARDLCSPRAGAAFKGLISDWTTQRGCLAGTVCQTPHADRSACVPLVFSDARGRLSAVAAQRRVRTRELAAVSPTHHSTAPLPMPPPLDAPDTRRRVAPSKCRLPPISSARRARRRAHSTLKEKDFCSWERGRAAPHQVRRNHDAQLEVAHGGHGVDALQLRAAAAYEGRRETEVGQAVGQPLRVAIGVAEHHRLQHEHCLSVC
jgi:hypothetical protein